jgi:hypothetical protein
MAGLYRAYKRRNNMVAYNAAPVLCLDAGSQKSYSGSGTTWTDLSGNSNNGTLVNSPTYDSSNYGSIVFNGTNQYSTTTNTALINPADNFTVECWFNFTALPTGGNFATIFGHYNGGGMFIKTDANQSNKLSIDGRNGNVAVGYFTLQTTIVPQTSTWYCFCATFSGVTITPYVNGAAVSFVYLAGGTGGVLNGAGTFAVNIAWLVGQVQGVGYFNGKIACCKVYDKVLTATEIATNFELLRGRYGISTLPTTTTTTAAPTTTSTTTTTTTSTTTTTTSLAYCVLATNLLNMDLVTSGPGGFSYANQAFTGAGTFVTSAGVRAFLGKSGTLNYTITNNANFSTGSDLRLYVNNVLLDSVGSGGNTSTSSFAVIISDVVEIRMIALSGASVGAGTMTGSFSITCP